MLRFSRVLRAKGTIPVILVEKGGLGEKGEIIQVKRGHARNHLFPKKIAIYDTPVNRLLMKEFTEKLDLSHRDRDRRNAKAQKRIEKVLVTIKRHMIAREVEAEDEYAAFKREQLKKREEAGELRKVEEPKVIVETAEVEEFGEFSLEKTYDGDMHAPVFKEDIAKFLWRQHFIEVDIDRIVLETPINSFGEHRVEIKLPEGDGTAELALEILPR